MRPRDVAEVLRLAAVCARHRVPLTVRGGGTGNYGQCVPLHGGIVMDATALDRVLRIEPGWACVQAGVLLHELNSLRATQRSAVAHVAQHRARPDSTNEFLQTGRVGFASRSFHELTDKKSHDLVFSGTEFRCLSRKF